ncbi:hypothetical protein ZEAMMB73_Zm00001d041436 [Zea mays]|uniref:Uncharacterized protein n=1 Tax=Zea mays TaxID=4577 RepID=A0A1D6MW19_MAIZE|nr:hypothetical protein ZEAMMB73_Zm00001d041436 [Zea mays]
MIWLSTFGIGLEVEIIIIHEQYNAFDVVMLLFYFHPSSDCWLMQIGWLLLFTKVLIMVVCLLSSFSSIYQSSNYGCVPSFNIFM